MTNFKFLRRRQVLKYGWKDAKAIAARPDVEQRRIAIFKDIIRCFEKYYLFSNLYKDMSVWAMSEEERDVKCTAKGEDLRKRDDFINYYNRTLRFLNKFTKMRWQTDPKLQEKRMAAYRRYYHWDKDVRVQYGVTIISEHNSIGKMTVGDSVLLARNVDVDLTGDITIGDNVSIMEGVKILTHGHDSFNFKPDSELIPYSNRAFKTNLVIGNNVRIGSHSIIMPGVHEIGENSFISSGSIVDKSVPRNVIVSGNPAKVVAKIPNGGKDLNNERHVCIAKGE